MACATTIMVLWFSSQIKTDDLDINICVMVIRITLRTHNQAIKY